MLVSIDGIRETNRHVRPGPCFDIVYSTPNIALSPACESNIAA